MRVFKTSIIAAFGLALTLAGVGSASADPVHPRRAEVVHRIHHQQHRIHHALMKGKLTLKQAHRLHRHEMAMLHREQRDARMHGGHITKNEQHALNRQLDRTSGRIGG